MAQRRMIARNIAKSKKLSKVSAKAALLYTWTIPFCDDFGISNAETYMIKHEIVPFRDDFVPRTITNCLKELQETGLINVYSVDGYRYLEVINFDRFQTIKPDRSLKALYPAPPEGYSNWNPVGNQKEDLGNPNGTPNLNPNININSKEKEKPNGVALDSLQFLKDIQKITARPPCKPIDMGSPNYKAALQSIEKMIEEHGYETVLQTAKDVHSDSPRSWTLFQFEWMIPERLNPKKPTNKKCELEKDPAFPSLGRSYYTQTAMNQCGCPKCLEYLGS